LEEWLYKRNRIFRWDGLIFLTEVLAAGTTVFIFAPRLSAAGEQLGEVAALDTAAERFPFWVVERDVEGSKTDAT